jgi:hypothetical protein
MTSEKSNGKIGKSVETNFYPQIIRLAGRFRIIPAQNLAIMPAIAKTVFEMIKS